MTTDTRQFTRHQLKDPRKAEAEARGLTYELKIDTSKQAAVSFAGLMSTNLKISLLWFRGAGKP